MAGRRVRRQKNLPPQLVEPGEPAPPSKAAEPVEDAESVPSGGPAGANGTAWPGGAAAFSQAWARLRAHAAQTAEEARALWARGTAPRTDGGAATAAPWHPRRWLARSGSAVNGSGAAPVETSDATRPVPALQRVRSVLAATNALDSEASDALATMWVDPARRPWAAAGAASILVIVLLIAVGLSGGRRVASPPTAVATQPTPEQPAATEPPQPAQPAVPAQPAPEQPAPAGETGQPTQPVQPPAPNLAERLRLPAVPEVTRQMALAALPLLLGLFWLLSAWLVDSEARRAFVIQEPWGERRTVAYSCLAVGCVFPLILAGLIFAAWGFVQFVVYIANRQSWIAGLQSGAVILFICACFLLLRSAVARWQDERRARQF